MHIIRRGPKSIRRTKITIKKSNFRENLVIQKHIMSTTGFYIIILLAMFKCNMNFEHTRLSFNMRFQ